MIYLHLEWIQKKNRYALSSFVVVSSLSVSLALVALCTLMWNHKYQLLDVANSNCCTGHLLIISGFCFTNSVLFSSLFAYNNHQHNLMYLICTDIYSVIPYLCAFMHWINNDYSSLLWSVKLSFSALKLSCPLCALWSVWFVHCIWW